MHARPAAELVKAAGGFTARISVTNEGREADAKSVLSLLTLAAECGSTLEISATGSDARQAVDAIVKLVAGGFSEEL